MTMTNRKQLTADELDKLGYHIAAKAKRDRECSDAFALWDLIDLQRSNRR